LQSHHYYTDYCKMLLNKKKQENLDRLLQKQQEVSEKQAEIVPASTETEITPEPGKKKKKGKEK